PCRYSPAATGSQTKRGWMPPARSSMNTAAWIESSTVMGRPARARYAPDRSRTKCSGSPAYSPRTSAMASGSPVPSSGRAMSWCSVPWIGRSGCHAILISGSSGAAGSRASAERQRAPPGAATASRAQSPSARAAAHTAAMRTFPMSGRQRSASTSPGAARCASNAGCPAWPLRADCPRTLIGQRLPHQGTEVPGKGAGGTLRDPDRPLLPRGCHAADEVGVEVPDLLMLHPRRLRHLLEARPPAHPHHLVAQRLLVAQLPKTVLLRLLGNVPRRQHERHVVPRLLRQIPRNLPVEL